MHRFYDSPVRQICGREMPNGSQNAEDRQDNTCKSAPSILQILLKAEYHYPFHDDTQAAA